MADLLDLLKGGDRRSTGRADEVVALVQSRPERLVELYAGLDSDDRLVRMRAADAIEKLSRELPQLVAPHAADLLHRAETSREIETRWHLAQMLPRLPLDADQRGRALTLLTGYLDDRSRIVQASALQALVELAADDNSVWGWLGPRLETAVADGPPAVRARARALLAARPDPVEAQRG